MAALRAIIGLGNPGEEYRATRHNAGFMVVEELARRRALAWSGEECRSRLAEAADLLLAQPQTYMNRSGAAARCLAERRGVAVPDLLIVYDDVYLPLGKLRLRPGGSPGGHRGMESVLENLCTAEVARLRLGVGPGRRAGRDVRRFRIGALRRGRTRAAARDGRASRGCLRMLAERRRGRGDEQVQRLGGRSARGLGRPRRPLGGGSV